MRTEAPEGFDQAQFFNGVILFQSWDIFPGCETSGVKHVQSTMRRLGMPDRLDGLRVLEIAPWNGFFAFELLRRGASEVVALGPDDPNVTGFNKTANLLDVEGQVRYVRDSIYNIGQHKLGTFDVVLCLGLLYHLRHPLLALDLLHDHCVAGGLTFIDTAVADHYDRVAPAGATPAQKSAWELNGEMPVAVFVRGDEVPMELARDPFNWYIPNAACVRAWARSSGYQIQFETADPWWTSLKLQKVERPFVSGLEGYSALAQGG